MGLICGSIFFYLLSVLFGIIGYYLPSNDWTTLAISLIIAFLFYGWLVIKGINILNNLKRLRDIQQAKKPKTQETQI